jgi:hypothetical protein
LIGRKAVSIVGINTKPLGYDRNMFEYWKFCNCDDLFILANNWIDKEKSDFTASMNNLNIDPVLADSFNQNRRNWKRIKTQEEIIKIVEYLDSRNNHEQELKSNLINNFLQDGNSGKINNFENITEPNITRSKKEEELASFSKSTISRRSDETTPVALKLITSKGPDIESTYVISRENAFESEVMGSDIEENDDIRSYEYFTFSKGKK